MTKPRTFGCFINTLTRHKIPSLYIYCRTHALYLLKLLSKFSVPVSSHTFTPKTCRQTRHMQSLPRPPRRTSTRSASQTLSSRQHKVTSTLNDKIEKKNSKVHDVTHIHHRDQNGKGGRFEESPAGGASNVHIPPKHPLTPQSYSKQ